MEWAEAYWTKDGYEGEMDYFDQCEQRAGENTHMFSHFVIDDYMYELKRAHGNRKKMVRSSG